MKENCQLQVSIPSVTDTLVVLLFLLVANRPPLSLGILGTLAAATCTPARRRGCNKHTPEATSFLLNKKFKQIYRHNGVSNSIFEDTFKARPLKHSCIDYCDTRQVSKVANMALFEQQPKRWHNKVRFCCSYMYN